MDKISCTNCKNITDFAGNYCECVLLHRFVDWYYWKNLAPDDCPERKKGKWINHRCDDGHHIADCDQCGHSLQWFDDDTPKYCCECGADMKGER